MGSTGSKPKDPAPTQEEKALAERSANQWNDYLERYVPLEDQAIELAKYDPNKTARLQGETSAMAAMGTKGEAGKNVKTSLKAGAGLGSGMTRSAAEDPTRAAASAGGLGAALAERSVRDRELQAKQKLTAFGRGLADQSTMGLSQLGRTRTDEALTKYKHKQDEKNEQLAAVGTALGFAAGYGLNRVEGYAADWRDKRAAASDPFKRTLNNEGPY
jgi:hypothetical protein